jgi:hypothetical protein
LNGGGFSFYDRWGIKMFESDKVAPHWNGKYKGNHSTPGTYYWIANYIATYLGEEHQFTRWMKVIK